MKKITVMQAVIASLSAIILFALILSGCHKNPTQPVEKSAVRIGWQVAWATQGQLAQVLQKTNSLSLLDLKGDFKSFTYGAPLSEAALANEIDVAFIGDQPGITLVSRSDDWKIAGRLMDFRVAIVVPPSSSITKIEDFEGQDDRYPFRSIDPPIHA